MDEYRINSIQYTYIHTQKQISSFNKYKQNLRFFGQMINQKRQIFLENANREYRNIDVEILQNNNEIKRLTAKIIKTDYENKLLDKLNQKKKQLEENQRYNQQNKKNQRELEKVYSLKIQDEKNMKQIIHNQYLTALEQKHLQQKEMEKKRIQQQKNLIRLNQLEKQAELERITKFNEFYKKRAKSDLQEKDHIKLQTRLNQEREKQIERQKYQDIEFKQNPKKESYKMFYQQFNNLQNQKQQNYKNVVMPLNQRMELEKINFINNSIKQEKIKTEQIYEQKINQELLKRRQLSQFLKKQIDDKQSKKYNQKIQNYEQSLQNLNNIKQVNDQEYNKMYQIKQAQKQFSYSTRGNSEPVLSKNDKLFVNHVHNPITNPIGFKIGITNPYILKEFQKAKEQVSGDKNLILKNLANVGQSTLHRN